MVEYIKEGAMDQGVVRRGSEPCLIMELVAF